MRYIIQSHHQTIRHLCSIAMVMIMVLMATLLEEKEIIFPEMAALTIGLWIIDKRVWRVKKSQVLWLMTLGATCGVCLVRYSPLSLIANLGLAFAFVALTLLMIGTTLIPLISACMLPVLLGTHSWVYPIAVFVLVLCLIIGQTVMERIGLRTPILFVPNERKYKKDFQRWCLLLLGVLLMSLVSQYTHLPYLIAPPLVVMFVEFVHSNAGFRSRPLQTLFLLGAASGIGVFFSLTSQCFLPMPPFIIAFCIIVCLFVLFKMVGKYFAPAGAIALLPMLLPSEVLIWFPFQVILGAGLFQLLALVAFQRCHRWKKVHWIVFLTSHKVRKWYIEGRVKPETRL